MKGDFLLEYCGELMSSSDANERQDQTFTYYFSIKNLHYWYDCIFSCFLRPSQRSWFGCNVTRHVIVVVTK
jgi:hypothetical protein